MKNTIIITGLTIRQKNALVKALTSGQINVLLNKEYMSDIFRGDQLHVLPIAEQADKDSPVYVKFLGEN